AVVLLRLPAPAGAAAAEASASESVEPSTTAAEAAGKRTPGDAASPPAAAEAAGKTPGGPHAARLAAQPGEEEEDEQKNQEKEPGRDRDPLLRARGRWLALVRIADALCDRGDAPLETLAELAGAERRQHRAILDLSDETVRQDALDPVAGEDAELAILGHRDDQHAGVLALAPHLPRIRHPHRVGEVV